MIFPSFDLPDDDEALEAEFPLGDGTADTEHTVVCPYCGEAVEIVLDPGGGAEQRYVEDCEVCCRPWNVLLRYHDDGSAEVELRPADE